jgi:hypothetical protein
MKLVGLIRTLVFSFSTTDSLLMLYFALVRSKLEYASVAWNSVTITDSNKFGRIQRKFAALCHNRFFQDMEYHFNNILKKLNLQTLHIRRPHFDALILIMSLVAINIVSLSWKQSTFVFLPGTYFSLTYSVSSSATALQLDVFLIKTQFVTVQIILVSHFLVYKALAD